MSLCTPEHIITDCDDLSCHICYGNDEDFTNYKDYDDEISERQEVREAFIR